MAASHGLTGQYYTASDPGSTHGSGGFAVDEYGVPTPLKDPDAVRVDPQIAFGRGKGFVVGEGPGRRGGRLRWWSPEETAHVAVIWNGYVRLPKAGTYYFSPVSTDPAAVYLNQSRVALKGYSGAGYIVSEAFTHADLGFERQVDPRKEMYIVPVTVVAPRDLPIEVRYLVGGLGKVGTGIDLYWVTPDSRRDASGKPIAELVPTEALYVEAPGPIETPAASGAHSTISSDVLYLPADTLATLTIRVADRQGRPLSGKRIHVSTLAERGVHDQVLQPVQPTDPNGITTARVKGSSRRQTSRFFATVLDEMVDVDQVTEITTVEGKPSFFPLTFAPYYDGKNFLVSPTPLKVGQPTTIKVPLTNFRPVPWELRVVYHLAESNIGSQKWEKIGETETFVLQPNESREAVITFTPRSASRHVCFDVEIWGRPLPRRADAGGWVRLASFTAPASAAVVQGAPAGMRTAQAVSRVERRTQNVGPVTCPVPEATPVKEETMGPPPPRGFVYTLPARGLAAPLHADPSPNSRVVGTPPNGVRLMYTNIVRANGQPTWYFVTPPGGTPGWIAAENTTGTRPTNPPVGRPTSIGGRPGCTPAKQTASATAGSRG